jgi:hypothetical protein
LHNKQISISSANCQKPSPPCLANRTSDTSQDNHYANVHTGASRPPSTSCMTATTQGPTTRNTLAAMPTGLIHTTPTRVRPIGCLLPHCNQPTTCPPAQTHTCWPTRHVLPWRCQSVARARPVTISGKIPPQHITLVKTYPTTTKPLIQTGAAIDGTSMACLHLFRAGRPPTNSLRCWNYHQAATVTTGTRAQMHLSMTTACCYMDVDCCSTGNWSCAPNFMPDLVDAERLW